MPRGKPNKRYTAEFKQMVIETMQKERLSYREAARQFEVCNHDRIEAVGTNLSGGRSGRIQNRTTRAKWQGRPSPKAIEA
jgi:hypothetical protein